MAERDSWASMNGVSGRILDAEDCRLGTTALLTPGASSVRARQGLRPGPGNPGLVTASGTPDVNVTVEKFQAVITATRGLGEYIATLDADKTIDVLGDNPAHGTQQRNHLIIALQTDTYYSDGSTLFEVVEVVGVAGAGDPSLAAYDDYIPLARLRITAGATTVTSAMIDDLRPSWFVALGGLLPVTDQTERDALDEWDGLHVYRRDRGWVEIHDGTAWRVQGIAVCTSTADRDSAITGPYDGQLAFTTDTNTLWTRQSGAWTSGYVRVLGGGQRDTDTATITTAETTFASSGPVVMPANSAFSIEIIIDYFTTVSGDEFEWRIWKLGAASPLRVHGQDSVEFSAVPKILELKGIYKTTSAETATWVATVRRSGGSGGIVCQPGSAVLVKHLGPESLIATINA